MGIWRGTKKVKCPAHSIISEGTWYQPDLLLTMFTLNTWLRGCLPGFSTVRLLFFFSHTLFFVNQSLSPTPTKEERWELSVNFLSWGRVVGGDRDYLDFFCKEDSTLLPHLFIQSFPSLIFNKCFLLAASLSIGFHIKEERTQQLMLYCEDSPDLLRRHMLILHKATVQFIESVVLPFTFFP